MNRIYKNDNIFYRWIKEGYMKENHLIARYNREIRRSSRSGVHPGKCCLYGL